MVIRNKEPGTSFCLLYIYSTITCKKQAVSFADQAMDKKQKDLYLILESKYSILCNRE